MNSIVICEDSPEQLAYFTETVQKYIMIEDLDLSLELTTANPRDVIEYYQTHPKGQTLYFLDIDLSTDINGIDLAKIIRNEDDLSKIVFITTLSESMPLVFKYKLEVLDFIIKDNFDSIKQQIIKCINTALNRRLLNQNEKQIFTVNLGRRTKLIDFSDIYYFQTAENHKIILVGDNQYIEYYDNLKNIIELTHFTQVHRSFVANLDNALSYNSVSKELHFPDDLSVPVGRTYQKDVRHILRSLNK